MVLLYIERGGESAVVVVAVDTAGGVSPECERVLMKQIVSRGHTRYLIAASPLN